MTHAELAKALDSTLLTADAGREQIERLADEAARLGCAAICVNPVHVEIAARRLGGTAVRVASVAGFPLGASPLASKLAECRFALERGATELDIVLPIWALVAGEWAVVEAEIGALLEATQAATRKLILEIALLTPQTTAKLAALLNRLRPEFAKTGTGYSRPVTADDVTALRGLLDPGISIKAAGGVRTRDQAEALLRAGALRIGTSCAAAILQGGLAPHG